MSQNHVFPEVSLNFLPTMWIKCEKPAGNHTEKMFEHETRQMRSFPGVWGDPPVKERVGESGTILVFPQFSGSKQLAELIHPRDRPAEKYASGLAYFSAEPQ